MQSLRTGRTSALECKSQRSGGKLICRQLSDFHLMVPLKNHLMTALMVPLKDPLMMVPLMMVPLKDHLMVPLKDLTIVHNVREPGCSQQSYEKTKLTS